MCNFTTIITVYVDCIHVITIYKVVLFLVGLIFLKNKYDKFIMIYIRFEINICVLGFEINIFFLHLIGRRNIWNVISLLLKKWIRVYLQKEAYSCDYSGAFQMLLHEYARFRDWPIKFSVCASSVSFLVIIEIIVVFYLNLFQLL